jgi:outer membrane protein insertion porin family
LKVRARWLYLFTFAISASACSTTRLLNEDEVLLKKNNISGLNKEYLEELKPLIKPKPNRKLFGVFLVKPWIYLKTSQGKQTDFKARLNRNQGEPPVLLDSTLTEESKNIIRFYLKDKGYFRGTVTAETVIHRKKATVNYLITSGPQYKIRQVEFENTGTPIDKFISYQLNSSEIQKGAAYDADKLNAFRNKIALYLRDNGFYYFNRDFIFYQIDTSAGKRQVDLTIKIKKAKQDFYYEPFRLDSIRVNADYSIFNRQDSLSLDSMRIGEFVFIDKDPITIRKDILQQQLLLHRDQNFSESTLRLSQSRINDLNVFDYVNYRIQANDSLRAFDLLILLSPATKRQIKTDLEASTNSVSLFGISGTITQINRNVFKGAELLELRANLGIESQQNVATAADFFERTTFNTLEYGFGVSLIFPRFLFPFNTWNTRNYTRPRTRFGLNYSNQIRLDFNRDVFQANVGYLWTNRVGERYEFYPLEINLARTNNISPTLDSSLSAINDPFLNFSFTNHLTTSTRLSYTSDNLRNKRYGRLTFTRVNLEMAGNTLYGIYALAGIQQDQGQKTIFNLPFFQYLRADVDLRQYWPQNEQQYIAGRFFLGVGLPLVNSNTLPLEKRYFIGGTNSIRAWQARTLGPGSFSAYNFARLDQFGEVKIEGSLENRFTIINKLKGAVFLDIGNIWTLKDTVSGKKDLTNFEFSRFWREIAIGTGFGIRYDFTYFVVRLDFGIKLLDPAFLPGQRWVIENAFNPLWRKEEWKTQLTTPAPLADRYRYMSFQIGIGYPF